MKLSISFNKPKTGQPVNAIPRPSSAFDTGVDEEVGNDLPISKNPRPHAVHAQGSSKLMKKRMEAERRLDETVYEYDEVWDKMQEAKQLQQTAKAVDASARKVCSSIRFSTPNIELISNLLAKVHTKPSFVSRYKEAGPPPSRRKDDAARA
jgi:hypothetical protein